MATTFDVAVDWTNDGTWVDISAYTLEASLSVGYSSDERHVADIGVCRLALDNGDRRFSPEHSGGPYYGNLLPMRPVRVRATSGSTWTLFRGYIRRIEPEAGRGGQRLAWLEAEDALTILYRHQFSMPLQENRNMAQLLQLVASHVWLGALATGTITFSGLPNADEMVTVGAKTYTFKATPSANYEVSIGTTAAECATYLAAAINDDQEYASFYGANTVRSDEVSAAAAAGVVTVTALVRGTLYNSVALSENATNVAVSGATLSGGTDAPSGLFSSDTGKRTFAIAADRWDGEDTNAMTAISEVVESEYGFFWIARNGTLTAKDHHWEQRLPSQAATMTVDNTHFDMRGEISDTRVANHIVVKYTPRRTETNRTIAQANNIIHVPGRFQDDRIERWNRAAYWLPTKSELLSLPPGAKVLRLGFVETETGEIISAKDIITPVAGTDYEVNASSDFNGFDYTNNKVIKVSVALTGGAVECTIENTALGSLYLRNFKVRGTAIIAYDTLYSEREKRSSIETYFRATRRHELSLESDGTFADSIANHLMNRYSEPTFYVPEIKIRDATQTIGGVHPLSLEIGNMLSLTETQTAISAQKHWVRGIDTEIDFGGGRVDVNYRLRRVDDVTYWILNDATYGVLNSTTRLGI